MSTTLRLPRHMTVAEFQTWEPPEDLAARRWELVDGEPVCMSPTTLDHGLIQSECALVLGLHLRQHRPGCRVITAPGVVPRVRAGMNERIPDLGVTCTPITDIRYLLDPLLLIEIISPSNEAKTRSNVWAYTTIPSVREVLILSGTSVAAELLRRDAAGAWPEEPDLLGPTATLHLTSIGFTAGLRALYATSSLA